ncbi:MAG: putative ABC transporter permease [Clostridiaceae bacterium]
MNNAESADEMLLFYSLDNNTETSPFWRKRFCNFEIYQFFWFLILFSILGFIMESGYSFFKHGYIESRRGLIFGPFIPIYGIATIVIILFLMPYKDSYIKLILGSFFYGSVLEYIFSVSQEYLFGTVSWDYSSLPFNINGRICLMYSAYWAILGTLIIRHLYPAAKFIISCIPRKDGEYLALLLAIFLIYDSFISVNAVIRASARASSIQPSSTFEKYIDSHYTDEFLQNIYPHMQYKGKL